MNMRRISALAMLLLTLFAVNHTAVAQDYFTDPIAQGIRVGIKSFATVPNSSGAPARMTVMTDDPLGRLFVGDQRGLIHGVSSDGAAVTPYIDIKDFSGVDLISGGEPGFQSFAFHPDFDQNGSGGFGKFYTIHSSSNVTPAADFGIGTGDVFHSVLMEWETNDPAANTYAAGGNASPREVLRFSQPFTNHNAGQIAFNTSSNPGTDRTNLYVALGDGGSGGDPENAGQTTSNPFGSIMRIDPLGTDGINGEYGIVGANVLASDGSADTLGEIFAFGFRNPQRFGWDTNGDMYIADIGQNAVEEIDLAVNGGNFGWRSREGSFPFNGGDLDPDMIDPVFEYDHTNLVANLPTTVSNRAVTVGEVVRGSGIAGLDGKLLLGDFPTGLLFYGDVDNDPLDGGQDGLLELILVDELGRDVRLLELINEARVDQGLGLVSRADLRFGYGIDGEVYILNKHDGIIRQLTFNSVPEPSGVALVGLLGLVIGIRRKKR